MIATPHLAEATDSRLSIYLECEGFNPTGSFKDRGMTMAVSKALESASRPTTVPPDLRAILEQLGL